MIHFLHNHQLYKLLPMKNVSVLPDEGFGKRDVEVAPGLVLPVHCLPKGNGSHRVIVTCSCGREIPFGRMGQHYKTHQG